MSIHNQDSCSVVTNMETSKPQVEDNFANLSESESFNSHGEPNTAIKSTLNIGKLSKKSKTIIKTSRKLHQCQQRTFRKAACQAMQRSSLKSVQAQNASASVRQPHVSVLVVYNLFNSLSFNFLRHMVLIDQILHRI